MFYRPLGGMELEGAVLYATSWERSWSNPLEVATWGLSGGAELRSSGTLVRAKIKIRGRDLKGYEMGLV